MKTLIYLAGLIAIGLAIAWFGFGVHPQTVYYKTIGIFSTASNGVATGTSDVAKTGNRFGEVIKNNYNDQDMTQPKSR